MVGSHTFHSLRLYTIFTHSPRCVRNGSWTFNLFGHMYSCHLFNQFTTPLCCDKPYKILLVTCSISNLFTHPNFEMHFFSPCLTQIKKMNTFLQNLSKIYSLMWKYIYIILNDFLKIKLNWIVLTNSTYIFPSRFIVVCTCKLSKQVLLNRN